MLLKHQWLDHGAATQVAQLLSASGMKINVIVGSGQLLQ
jgi:hypothetical protein